MMKLPFSLTLGRNFKLIIHDKVCKVNVQSTLLEGIRVFLWAKKSLVVKSHIIPIITM